MGARADIDSKTKWTINKMALEQIFEERGNKKLGRNLIGPD